ncbi:Barstar (barnase inhibitor) [Luteibacter sp. 22Crub2.1]|nr:Barstar (barnase inhibitor) [Luteibacter sp. 22Crub2.1]
MKGLSFYQMSPVYVSDETFLLRIDLHISSVQELMSALHYGLWLPGCFGFNWNALFDCLLDLTWLPCAQVVIYHSSLPRLPDEELARYISVLSDAVNEQNDGTRPRLSVVFPADFRAEVMQSVGHSA